MKLRLGIQRVGSIVFGRVLEQDDELRGRGLLATGGTVVGAMRSDGSPALYHEKIFILGSMSANDSSWFAHDFRCESDAAQAVEDIKILVATVNGHQDAPDDCGLEIIE